MRNLNADEIYDQVVAIDRQSRLYFDRPLSNIVFMGMGEPLMNYKNLINAIEKITHRMVWVCHPRESQFPPLNSKNNNENGRRPSVLVWLFHFTVPDRM